MNRQNGSSVPGTGNSSPLNPNAPVAPVGMASQTGRGASVVSLFCIFVNYEVLYNGLSEKTNISTVYTVN